ncbi:MAG: hypothetical protein EXR72_09405 [Myxococcales bacterium]|nr:hypothetical protein [Myxococcales bacterium]
MGTKLFVGNLSYSITELELREAFAQSGRTVQSVRIALDRETQRPRGFAFVEVATDADADSAIKEWNGTMLAGRAMAVEKAQERVPGAPRPAGPPRRPMGGGPAGGGYGGARPFSGPPQRGFGAPMASAEPQREEQRRRQARPEKKIEQKKKSSRPKEEERERGKWRWDGKTDD